MKPLDDIYHKLITHTQDRLLACKPQQGMGSRITQAERIVEETLLRVLENESMGSRITQAERIVEETLLRVLENEIDLHPDFDES